MRILVISDTHGYIEKAKEVIRRTPGIDMVIHLGDNFRDAQKLQMLFPRIRVEYVYGNSDFFIGEVSGEKVIECNGKKIFMTHGHRYSVKWDRNKLHKKAEEIGADVILYGHTHIADLKEEGNCLFLNPGSITEARGDSIESYAILELEENNIKSDLIYV